jgi:hypothetical protein
MANPTVERHALHLTLDQLGHLEGILAASVSADPGETSILLEQVRKVRRYELAKQARMANCKHEFIEFTYGPYCHKCTMPEPVESVSE